ncbi:Ammonium transporter 1 member [Ooceraea biroi]|nr:Ammonium transporter 1 member [Ooceraea biroi]
MYFLTGFLVAYNGDLAGLIGEGYWIGDPMVDKNEAITGWQAIVIASAICTTAVAGRMHAAGYLLVGALLSGLIQPLLIHWAWTAEGWMAENELGGRIVSFKDYAGAAVVHVVGGLSGLIGCITLGRRMLRLKDLDDASITAGSAGTVFGGLLLILAGLQGLCTSTYERDKFRMSTRDPSHAYVNNLLAAASCTLLVVALHSAFSRESFNHWTAMRCVQGMLAGVVTVSAAANEYSPQTAIALGCLGGVAFYLISRQVFRSALEDYCNVVAVHLVCAILGSVLAPFCAVHLDTEDTTTLLLNFSWQLICLAALFALVGTAMLLVFGMLELCGILRNRSEWLNHVRANVAVDRGPPRSFLRRLFFPDSGSVYLQPGSISSTDHRPSADSRFCKYQTEIDKLEKGRFTSKREMNIKNEDSVTQPLPTGTRIKKARQVHTLSGSIPVVMEDQGGTGESINHNLPEIVRKQFLGREIKHVLDPIEEIDEEHAKECEVQPSNPQRNIEDCNAGDENSIFRKSINAFATTRDSNESNYQLRRTAKLINLHHELSKEDLRVVFGPKRVDSSSSDSCDEDIIFARNESVRDIMTSNDSLIHGTN